jgi:hypothetical protein
MNLRLLVDFREPTSQQKNWKVWRKFTTPCFQGTLSSPRLKRLVTSNMSSYVVLIEAFSSPTAYLTVTSFLCYRHVLNIGASRPVRVERKGWGCGGGIRIFGFVTPQGNRVRTREINRKWCPKRTARKLAWKEAGPRNHSTEERISFLIEFTKDEDFGRNPSEFGNLEFRFGWAWSKTLARGIEKRVIECLWSSMRDCEV